MSIIGREVGSGATLTELRSAFGASRETSRGMNPQGNIPADGTLRWKLHKRFRNRRATQFAMEKIKLTCFHKPVGVCRLPHVIPSKRQT